MAPSIPQGVEGAFFLSIFLTFSGEYRSQRSSGYSVRWRPYRAEYTGSLPNSEVNRRRARSVLNWGTVREHPWVLPAFCFCCSFFWERWFWRFGQKVRNHFSHEWRLRSCLESTDRWERQPAQIGASEFPMAPPELSGGAHRPVQPQNPSILAEGALA